MFEKVTDFLERNHRVELRIAVTENAKKLQCLGDTAVLLVNSMSWKDGDRFFILPDDTVEQVIYASIKMRRYRKFIAALRSTGFDLVHNPYLKAAEIVKL